MFCLSVCLCRMLTPAALRDQKEISDPLDLELQIFVC